MKIGYFTDSYAPMLNGVATTIEELKDSLKSKHDIFLVAPEYPGFKDKDKKIARLKSFRFYKNPELRLAYMFPNASLKDVLAYKYDLIHGFSGGSIVSLGLFLAKIKRIPYIFTYNTRYEEYTHYLFKGKLIKPKVAEVAMTVFCNQCDVIVAPSDYIKNQLLAFGVKKPVVVIPNGVDIKAYTTTRNNLLKEKLNLKSTDKIILYLGRLAKEKSIDLIIKSFIIVSKNNPNAYLVIAGDGTEKANLIKLVAKLKLTNKIFFLGFVERKHVPLVYAGADIFAFSSITETQGLVVLEAMAAGLPSVLAKYEVYDSFIEDGKTAIVVKMDDKSFAKGIEKLLKDANLCKIIGENSRKRAEDFSLEEIAKKFDTLYKSLV